MKTRVWVQMSTQLDTGARSACRRRIPFLTTDTLRHDNFPSEDPNRIGIVTIRDDFTHIPGYKFASLHRL